MEKAIFKFNNGNGALLCSKCSVIIKTGREFNSDEVEAMRGKKDLPAQFCSTCSVNNFKWKLKESKLMHLLIDFCKENPHWKAYVVGGWVRDMMLGIPSDDIDVVIEGDGIKFAQEFAHWFDPDLSVVVFKRFGTAKIADKGLDFDFVGARKESYDPTSRNPSVQNGTIFDDISRRDLTINAMALSLHPDTLGDLVDPFNGQKDLERGLIQTPIEPNETFKDDPLRMLRAVRFAARFGFKIEHFTLSGIKDNVKRLSIISDERICTELEKTLKSKNPKLGFELLDETGLLSEVLPELVKLKGRSVENGVTHKDNFIHTLQVLENTRKVTDDIHLLWTAVLHDIGKARVKKFENNSWQFHNHEIVSERMINAVAERLKWSSAQTDKVKKLTKFHGIPKELVKEGVSDSAIRRFVLDTEDIFEDLITFCKCDITTKFADKLERQQKAIESLKERSINIREADDLRNWKNPVSGHFLIQTLGIKPGRLIGETLAAVKEAIMEGEIPNETEKAQEFAIEWIRKNKTLI